jgi:hypothetical protein
MQDTSSKAGTRRTRRRNKRDARVNPPDMKEIMLRTIAAAVCPGEDLEAAAGEGVPVAATKTVTTADADIIITATKDCSGRWGISLLDVGGWT